MELELTIETQVKQTLNLLDEQIPHDANLIEYGLHSIAIMQLVDGFQLSFDRELNYVDFATMPTINEWAALLVNKPARDSDKVSEAKMSLDSKTELDDLLDLVVNEEGRESPLSQMQYSYWAGQQSTDVSPHLYVEFDGKNLKPEKLLAAIRDLFKLHPMLRAIISDSGSQTYAEIDPKYQINIDDISECDTDEVDAFLKAKRHSLSHQELAIQLGQVIYFDLTLLPQNAIWQLPMPQVF